MAWLQGPLLRRGVEAMVATDVLGMHLSSRALLFFIDVSRFPVGVRVWLGSRSFRWESSRPGPSCRSKFIKGCAEHVSRVNDIHLCKQMCVFSTCVRGDLVVAALC